MIPCYPLQWPAHWPRTQRPERSRFGTGLFGAEYDVKRELRLLGATDIVISTNLKRNLDGSIAARQPWIGDAGVAVYFTLNGRQQCIPCDKWDQVQDNLRAIAKTVEALRGIGRWGSRQIVDATFAGFDALPSGENWWDILQVAPDAPKEQIVRQYRQLVKQHHPDAGGDPETFHRIQQAYEQAVAA